jgi:hypothetical protein
LTRNSQRPIKIKHSENEFRMVLQSIFTAQTVRQYWKFYNARHENMEHYKFIFTVMMLLDFIMLLIGNIISHVELSVNDISLVSNDEE